MATTRLPLFPPTRHTWIGDRLAGDDEDRRSVLQHLMSVYSWPLQVYYRHLTLPVREDPADVVHGFFASRLGRGDDYLERWRASGLPLRRWLMNGLHFYLRERARDRRPGLGEPCDSLPAPDAPPAAAMDRAFALSMTRVALENASQRCREEGLADHWQVFLLRRWEDASYSEIEQRLGIPRGRAATMVRTAGKRFRGAMLELLKRDGCPSERLQEALDDLLVACAEAR